MSRGYGMKPGARRSRGARARKATSNPATIEPRRNRTTGAKVGATGSRTSRGGASARLSQEAPQAATNPIGRSFDCQPAVISQRLKKKATRPSVDRRSREEGSIKIPLFARHEHLAWTQ